MSVIIAVLRQWFFRIGSKEHDLSTAEVMCLAANKAVNPKVLLVDKLTALKDISISATVAERLVL